MTMTNTDLAKTPFHDFHVASGAKMVEFAGFRMPIQYRGITEEHLAVRSNIGLFDLTHMGEFEVRGSNALEFLQKTTTNNVASLEVGQIQYSCMTNENGGIVDDLLVYRLESSYLLIVNAANIKKDFQWLSKHVGGDVQLSNQSDRTALLAIQGPRAQLLMAELTDYDLESMPYYTSAVAKLSGEKILFSRTGYTGEDGFELYIPYDRAEPIWKAVTGAGRRYDLQLIGLAARDSLRLEMKMALYGNDIDESTTPIEAGLGWIVDLGKNFIGKDIIAAQKAEKPARRLVCLELHQRAVPRKGYDIFVNGKKEGRVTSGAFSPSLQKPIALGYVPRSSAKIGSQVEVAIRDRRIGATVVKPPFYKEASHK